MPVAPDDDDVPVPAPVSKSPGNKPSRELAEALEKLVKAVFDNTPRVAGSFNWNPHAVRPAVVKVEALLQDAPADVVAKLREALTFISDQTVCHMVHWAPGVTRGEATRIQWMLDDWAGRPRRKNPRVRTAQPDWWRK